MPPEERKKAEEGLVSARKEFLDKVKNITGSVAVSGEVKAEFVIACKNTDSAKEVADMIEKGLTTAKGFIAFGVADKKQLATALSILETVKSARRIVT